MANELSTDNYGSFWCAAETTYGTDAVSGIADAIYVDNSQAMYVREIIKRTGKAPYRDGHKSFVGRAHVPWSLTTDIGVQVIADPPIAGNVPPCDAFLQACGFQRVLGGAGQNSIGYFLRSHNFGSMTLYDHETNELNDNEKRVIGLGARGNCAFSTGSDGRIIADASGFALPLATLANTSAATGSAAGLVTYTAHPPLIFQGARTRIHRHSDNAVYGGGSLSSLTNAATLISFSIDPQMNPTEEFGGHAVGGIARIGLRPQAGTPVLINFSVEVQDEDEWSWEDIRDTDTLAFDVRPVAAGNTARTCQMLANGQVVDITKGADGRRTYGITMEARWPEDAADGGPAVGTDPASSFTVGTNEGLDEVPTGATPVPAMLAFLFDAAS
jgi:hypothetical protein